MCPKLSSDVRLLCSSGPVGLAGGELPITPPPTSDEPQLFLLADSLSRLDLAHMITGLMYKLPYKWRKLVKYEKLWMDFYPFNVPEVGGPLGS